MQLCNNCDQEKPLARFRFRKNKHEKQCHDCINAKARAKTKVLKDNLDEDMVDDIADELIAEFNEARIVAQNAAPVPDGMKKCTNCLDIKQLNLFRINRGKSATICAACDNARSKEGKRLARLRKIEAKVEAGTLILPVDPDNNKVCPYCHKEKSSDCFRPKRQKCQDCERDNGRDYRKTDNGKEKAQQWVEGHQGRMTELQTVWYQDNKESINKKNCDRYKNDAFFRLRHTYKTSLQHAYNDYVTNGTNTQLEYLGCNMKFFINWLKFRFDKTMTLKNHGTCWHFDHVIPLGQFDLTDPTHITTCFHWTNVMPLKASTNMSKHATLDELQLITHIDKLLTFIGSNHTLEKLINTGNHHILVFNEYIRLCARHLISGNPLRALVTHSKQETVKKISVNSRRC
jgi:hypothetical protein